MVVISTDNRHEGHKDQSMLGSVSQRVVNAARVKKVVL